MSVCPNPPQPPQPLLVPSPAALVAERLEEEEEQEVYSAQSIEALTAQSTIGDVPVYGPNQPSLYACPKPVTEQLHPTVKCIVENKKILPAVCDQPSCDGVNQCAYKRERHWCFMHDNKPLVLDTRCSTRCETIDDDYLYCDDQSSNFKVLCTKSGEFWGYLEKDMIRAPGLAASDEMKVLPECKQHCKRYPGLIDTGLCVIDQQIYSCNPEKGGYIQDRIGQQKCICDCKCVEHALRKEGHVPCYCTNCNCPDERGGE